MNKVLIRSSMAALLGLAVAVSSAPATPFTTTSPINGGSALPAGVTQVGGIVFQARGLNGVVVTSQLAASSLYVGFAGSNPQLIGTQAGFSAAILGALGGGFSEAAVRITLSDGDTGIGDFDQNQNFLLLNGINFGDFTGVAAQNTNGLGTVDIGVLTPGFNDGLLDTGFFYTANAVDLAALFGLISGNGGNIAFALNDLDPGENFYDFTQGVDGGLINVGQGPTIDAVPEPASLALWSILGLTGGFGAWRRRKANVA